MIEIITIIAGSFAGYIAGRIASKSKQVKVLDAPVTYQPQLKLESERPAKPKPKAKAKSKKHYRRTWTKTELPALESMVKQGYSQSKIARLLGRPTSSIYNRTKKIK